jgi:hypothetical protein
MEKRDKIIIAGLIIVIIALIAGLAFMSTGNNSSTGEATASDGMKIYDFNSEFKMEVPKSVKFLKSWNNTDDAIFGQGYTYFDEYNEIMVAYVDSPMITHEFVDAVVDMANSSGNVTVEFEGDLIISHSLKNDGSVGNSAENSNFTNTVMLQKGHMLVGISGNDLDLIKSMIKTVEFYE